MDWLFKYRKFVEKCRTEHSRDSRDFNKCRTVLDSVWSVVLCLDGEDISNEESIIN